MKKTASSPLRLLSLLSLCLLGWTACTSDQLPALMETDCVGDSPTYNNDIAPIIESSCAYSSCHLDLAPGRFDTYAGLLPYLEDNTFRQRVISERADPNRGMPPNFVPSGRNEDLSEEELQLIECWLQAGFPE